VPVLPPGSHSVVRKCPSAPQSPDQLVLHPQIATSFSGHSRALEKPFAHHDPRALVR
jgi:hypothetical protein